jgi:hypothetical protein
LNSAGKLGAAAFSTSAAYSTQQYSTQFQVWNRWLAFHDILLLANNIPLEISLNNQIQVVGIPLAVTAGIKLYNFTISPSFASFLNLSISIITDNNVLASPTLIQFSQGTYTWRTITLDFTNALTTAAMYNISFTISGDAAIYFQTIPTASVLPSSAAYLNANNLFSLNTTDKPSGLPVTNWALNPPPGKGGKHIYMHRKGYIHSFNCYACFIIYMLFIHVCTYTFMFCIRLLLF